MRGYQKSVTFLLYIIGFYHCFTQTMCINNDFWQASCLFYLVESVLVQFQQVEKILLQKLPWNTANDQNCVTFKKTCGTPCKKPHCSVFLLQNHLPSVSVCPSLHPCFFLFVSLSVCLTCVSDHGQTQKKEGETKSSAKADFSRNNNFGQFQPKYGIRKWLRAA